jgi:hypothetical protein
MLCRVPQEYQDSAAMWGLFLWFEATKPFPLVSSDLLAETVTIAGTSEGDAGWADYLADLCAGAKVTRTSARLGKSLGSRRLDALFTLTGGCSSACNDGR